MTQKKQWTDEQRDAIELEDCSLLVSAAAGAGKTTVLVERIIRKITDLKNPTDIDRLLVMTFTNAAATEMKERIVQALSEALESERSSPLLQRQLTLLNNANIMTVHSFCLQVIRNNFMNLDIDPGFRIADETETQLIKYEAIDELFEERYEAAEIDPDFLNLLDNYGTNKDDQQLQELVLGIYDFVQSSPWPFNWLEEMIEKYNLSEETDFFETEWGKVLAASIQLELTAHKQELSDSLNAVRSSQGLEKYADVLEKHLDDLEYLIMAFSESQNPFNEDGVRTASRWNTIREILQGIEFTRMPNAGKDADPVIKERVKNTRNNYKEYIKVLKDSYFGSGEEFAVKDFQTLYPLLKFLGQLVKDFGKKYSEKKDKKTILDFSDLEHYCLEILTERCEDGSILPSKVAFDYREKFKEVLIDEYQDSNLVQETILKMISRSDDERPNVFMVGDVKQSIYRFRQARPEIFMDKYYKYKIEKNAALRKILLHKNYRSRFGIIDAVNYLFGKIMSKTIGELEYTSNEALYAGANYEELTIPNSYTGGETEFHVIQTNEAEDPGDISAAAGAEGDFHTGASGNDDSSGTDEAEFRSDPTEGNDQEEDRPDVIQTEARLAAKRISELMSTDENGRRFYVFDKGNKKYREVEYKDIVILLRSVKNRSEIYLDELSALSIPAFSDTGTGFFKTSEVQVVLSLLQIIDNPLQDIPLLAVLRSPIGGFTTEDLTYLRLADIKSGIYDALCVLSKDEQGRDIEASELQNYRKTVEKAKYFLAALETWREKSRYLSTDQLLWMLYSETGYYGMVAAMKAGEQRQANLRILFERAKQFEETSYKGLFNFISFIDKLKTSGGDMGSAKILGENENVVRIMSIHKSKGLEFPVVILAGCGKRFNLMDMNKGILLHQELGFGPDIVDREKRITYPSLAKTAIREKIKIETLSEEMRLLYVGMTRAREKLIITGAAKNLERSIAKWKEIARAGTAAIPPHMIKNANCYLDWIGPAVLHSDSKWQLIQHYREDILRDVSHDKDEGGRATILLDELEAECAKEKRVDKAQEITAAIKEDMAALRDQGLSKASEKKDDALQIEVERRLCWEYPYKNASVIPGKISVTELKRRFNVPESDEDAESGGFTAYTMRPNPVIKKPKFLEEKIGLSGAEAGTATHFVLQHLDYNNPDIDSQIEDMVKRDLLTKAQADAVNVKSILNFLESPLGKRMLNSGTVHREVPFNLELPCHEFYESMCGDENRSETMILQGIIDCYFEEQGKLVLLDYKTDYVEKGKTEIIKERYALQLKYYARALEKLTGKKVANKYIYLLRISEAAEIF